MIRMIPSAFVLASLIAVCGNALALERILDFHSDITVHRDGSMQVRETIVVQAEGRDIKRGIYRDFPTTYRDRLGNRYRVGFKITDVRRNDRPEDFHTKTIDNGVRVYMGNKSRFVRHGEHRYELTYRTDRQLGFFDEHDELYWNVTGNKWKFFIDSASASVRLPTTVPLSKIRVEGYTGPQESKGQDYDAAVENGQAEFASTQRLSPREGLTIVVMWPKGHIHEPDASERLQYTLSDNRHLIIMFTGIAVVLAYYLLVWSRVGRDRPEGVIVPLYFPPKGYSPASMRFIRRRGYDHKTFATALVNLAVKGFIDINESDESFSITRKDDPPGVNLAAGESALLKQLLGNRQSITLEQSRHALISKAIDAHKKSLKRDYEKIYFVKNSGWIVPGVLLSLLVYTLGLVSSPIDEALPTVFLSLWLSVWSVVVYFLSVNAVHAFRAMRGTNGAGRFLHALLFAGAFGFFEIMGIAMFILVATITVLSVLLVLVGVNTAFYHLLHADTRAGRKLLDKAEGFREYLEVPRAMNFASREPPARPRTCSRFTCPMHWRWTWNSNGANVSPACSHSCNAKVASIVRAGTTAVTGTRTVWAALPTPSAVHWAPPSPLLRLHRVRLPAVAVVDSPAVAVVAAAVAAGNRRGQNRLIRRRRYPFAR